MAPTRNNQVLIDYHHQRFFCHPCGRTFCNGQAAITHCRTSSWHLDEWCERCQWLFVSPEAMSDHLAHSSHHHICQPCNEDFPDSGELEEHTASVHVQRSGYSQTSNRHHGPARRFRTYQPNSIECFGCYKQFSTFSGMFMHLESGACKSQIYLHDIDEFAFLGIDSDEYTNAWRSHYKYRCPTCNSSFRVISALFQHIEEKVCGQKVQGSVRSMLNFIRWKLAYD